MLHSELSKSDFKVNHSEDNSNLLICSRSLYNLKLSTIFSHFIGPLQN